MRRCFIALALLQSTICAAVTADFAHSTYQLFIKFSFDTAEKNVPDFQDNFLSNFICRIKTSMPDSYVANVSHSGYIQYRIDHVSEKDVPNLKDIFNKLDEEIKNEYFQLGHKTKEFLHNLGLKK